MNYFRSRFGHWSPRYVWNRLALKLHERNHPEHPWLTADAVHILEELLRPSDKVLEYGAGRSTTWFAKRARQVVSVEHSREWYEWVSAEIAKQQLKNVKLIHVPLTGADIDDPQTWSRYVSGLRRWGPHSFDVILIDGLFRDQCALFSIDRLRSGGILVIDNANWYLPFKTHSPASVTSPRSSTWRSVQQELAGWRCIRTTNGVTDTLLALKA